MRIRVFSAESNPACDSPLCHKSESYANTLIHTLRAFRLDEQKYPHAVQLFPSVESVILPRHWQPLRGSMQLIEGDIEGRKGHFSYPIPACGARTRRMSVYEINCG